MHRNKPDVWEVCSKVSKMISKPKRKNKKIVYDEEGNKVMEQVSVTEAIIEDDDHWKEMKSILRQYKELKLRTKLSQGDINVSDAEYHWNRIAAKYENEKYKYNDKFVSESIRKRWKLIEDDIHHAGKHSDPRRVGEATTAESYKKAIRFYKANLGEDEWNNKWVYVYNMFHDHAGVFEMRPLLDMKHHDMHDCIDYWKFFGRFEITLNGKKIKLKKFTIVMVNVQKSRGTNAKIESTFNYVKMRQSNYRGSLGPASLDTEVYCAVNMNFIGKDRIFEFYGLSKDVLQKRKYEKKQIKKDQKKAVDSDGNYSDDYASSYNSKTDSDSYGSDYSEESDDSSEYSEES
eukprot:178208_1